MREITGIDIWVHMGCSNTCKKAFDEILIYLEDKGGNLLEKSLRGFVSCATSRIAGML